jgi:predicted RNA polymerase sigma factor
VTSASPKTLRRKHSSPHSNSGRKSVPDNPAAWLTATAKRRAIDLFRRNAVAEGKHEELARELEALEQTSPDSMSFSVIE